MKKAYLSLQNVIDDLISNIGTENLVNFLNLVKTDNFKGDEIINEFIMLNVGQLLKISVARLKNGADREASKGRMICYMLIKKHNNLSNSKIGLLFNNKPKAVVGSAIKKIEWYLGQKEEHLIKPFDSIITIYNIVDNKTENFLIVINNLSHDRK